MTVMLTTRCSLQKGKEERLYVPKPGGISRAHSNLLKISMLKSAKKIAEKP